MILNTKFHEILFISSRATLATKFLSQTHRLTDTQTHKHTDRHFPEIVKSCSGRLKTYKSIENWKSISSNVINQLFCMLTNATRNKCTQNKCEKYNIMPYENKKNELYVIFGFPRIVYKNETPFHCLLKSEK